MSNILNLEQPPTSPPKSARVKDLITVRQAAQVAGVGEFAIRAMVRRGRFPAVRENGRLLIHLPAVKQYVGRKEKREARTGAGAATPDGFLSTPQAAEFLGVCEETVRRAHRRGRLRGRIMGIGLMFSQDDIERAKILGLKGED